MKLDRYQRWVLSNQYLILMNVDPENKDSHEDRFNALVGGFESAYDWHSPIDDEVLSVEECGEVQDILTMFRVLKYSYERMDPKPEVDQRHITFSGFDGNNDKQYSFMRYLEGQGKYEELNLVDSHSPVLDMYRRMVGAWRSSQNSSDLTADDIVRIANARVNL